MKLSVIIGGALVGLLATSTLTTQAQTRTPVVNSHQRNQVRRINQGARSGELTRAEQARLRAREQNIRTDKRIAKSNGYVSPAERARLRAKEARLSRAIYRKKHNGRSY